jgi:hypothetical protein
VSPFDVSRLDVSRFDAAVSSKTYPKYCRQGRVHSVSFFDIGDHVVNDLDQWFEQAAARGSRTPSLYTSLLTNRVFRYCGYRLRFSLLLTTVRFIVHAIEFFVVFATLGGLATLTVMVLRIGGLLVGGAWWGLLDIMRERLRGYARDGDRNASEREIGRWLVLSMVLAATFSCGAGVALVHYLPAGAGGVAQLYALLIVIELAIEFPVRVLHSGIFATRRVFRPTWSLFAPLAVQLAVLSCGFYFYPAAAIIMSIVISNAIGIWISVHYSIEVYRLTGLRPKMSAPVHTFWRSLPTIPVWSGITTTLSATALRLDGVLVLSIAGIYGTDERSFDLTAGDQSWSHVDVFQFFYLVLPLMRGAFAGADVFFFDLVRLRSSPVLREFQLRFFEKLLWLMPAVAIYFWLLATLLGSLVLSDVPFGFLLALLPLFVVRALIGTYEIRLFAEGRSAVHIATMVFLSVLLWLVWISPNPASDLIEITAAMTAELILLINVQHWQDRKDLELPTLVTLADWLRALDQERLPVRIGRIEIPGWATPKQRASVVRTMEKMFDDPVHRTGRLAYASATRLLYYERTSSADHDRQTHLELQRVTGGTASRTRALPGPSVDGGQAGRRLIDEKWLSAPEDGSQSASTLESLIPTFREIFPSGTLVDLGTLAGAREVCQLDRQVLAETLPAAMRCLDDGTTMTFLQGHWMTPIYDRGVLRLVFFLPAEADTERVRLWRTAIRNWQLSPLPLGSPVGVPA